MRLPMIRMFQTNAIEKTEIRISTPPASSMGTTKSPADSLTDGSAGRYG